MIRHVAMFKWADSVDAARIAATATALDALPGLIPEIVVYRHGADLGLNDRAFDYVVVADFSSVDDYLTYRDHPDHRALVDEFVNGHVAGRVNAQYEIAD